VLESAGFVMKVPPLDAATHENQIAFLALKPDA
jgi:hypothetical protein